MDNYYKIRIALSIILSICMVSCSNSEKQHGYEILVVKDYQKKDISLNDVVIKTEIHVLHTKQDDPIGNVKSLCVTDSCIYVLDGATASIYCFDLEDGKLIKKINKKGNGPKEYVSPTSIDADSKNLFLLDMPTNNVICFDLNLNPVESFRLSFPSSDLACTNKMLFFYNLDDLSQDYKFIRTDKKGTIAGKYLKYENKKASSQYSWGAPGRLFSKCGDTIFFSEPFSNEIYTLRDGKPVIEYVIDFGNRNVPNDINPKDINIYEQDQYTFNVNFFVTEKVFVNSFLENGKRYYSFYNKQSRKLRAGCVKDKEYGLPFFPHWQYQNQLIGTCLYSDLKDNISKMKNDPTINIHFDKNSVDDEDILLLLYTIKS